LKFVDSKILSSISFLKPNEDELLEMASHILKKQVHDIDLSIKTLLNQGVKVRLCFPEFTKEHSCYKVCQRNNLSFRGEKGVIFSCKEVQKSFPALKVEIVNTTGAGDNFVGGFCYGLVNNYSIEECIQFGQNASKMALSTDLSVHPKLSEENIKI
jgi:fructose-1-phosphate kinase PfkB-like protein